MKIENIAQSMKKFHSDSLKLRFGFVLFEKYLNDIMIKAMKGDEREMRKIIYRYGFKFEDKVFVGESNCSLWEIWFALILTESQRVRLYGNEKAYLQYNKIKNKLK